jgi:hypothetical protein
MLPASYYSPPPVHRDVDPPVFWPPVANGGRSQTRKQLEQTFVEISNPPTIRAYSASNATSLPLDIWTRLSSWVYGTEDKVFNAATILHIPELNPTLDTTKAAAAIAYEFERVVSVAQFECAEWWWVLYIFVVVLPHSILSIDITLVTELLMMWDPDTPDLPYALLFFGSIGLAVAQYLTSSLVLYDWNPGRRARVLSIWNQVVFMVLLVVDAFIAIYNVPVMPALVAVGGIETLYIFVLTIVVFLDRKR